MKSYEVLELNKKSVFKTILYLMIIPMALIFIIGLGIMVVGILIKEPFAVGLGVPYMIMPIILIFIYGLFSMLVALVYNKLARRFGGLELKLVEKNPPGEGKYLS